MAEERLQPLLDRLERERADADQRYNDALTALDQVSRLTPVTLPIAPRDYDPSRLEGANRTWDILAAGPPPIDRSLKGRLRGLIWRIVGPPLERQQAFNSAIIDHLNRNVVAHQEAQESIAAALATVTRLAAEVNAFQHAVILYLQTITLYVDTKDRAAAATMNAGLSAISEEWLKRWESLAARERRFQTRIESIDDLRATSALAQQTSVALKREVERLYAAVTAGGEGTSGTGQPPGAPAGPATPPAAAAAASGIFDAFKYVGFEDAFRGSDAAVRARLEGYVPAFAGQTDVLDLGCGRGEFLDLLRDAGIRARGLDLNHDMVEASRARGHEVAEGDALSYLASLADASLGGIFAAQVVEHLEPDYLGRVLETARLKLRSGGVLVLETINVSCWLAFFESYIRDLTHVRPLHPETLQYLVRASGFHDVRIEFKSPVDRSARLAPAVAPGSEPALREALETLNENMAKLNDRLFTSLDYAVLARA